LNKRKPDFTAELRYLTTEEGGRKTPVWSIGYRPQVKFPFEDVQTSGEQTFLNKEVVYPGDTVIAEIAIISTEIFEYKLAAGQEFDFREGARIIGTGKILEVVNPILKLANKPSI